MYAFGAISFDGTAYRAAYQPETRNPVRVGRFDCESAAVAAIERAATSNGCEHGTIQAHRYPRGTRAYGSTIAQW